LHIAANQEKYLEFVWNNNSPDNRHIIAKVFIKYFYSIALINHNFCPNVAIAGLQEHGGVGER
jgi:hypothetical protein